MTIRASSCLAAIAGSLGFFAIGSAHADTSFGATHFGAARLASATSIVTKAGLFERGDCDQPAYRERKPCKRWRVQRRRHVERFPRPWPRFHYGRDYEVYTYRRPYSPTPRMDIQMIYGWYRGYYNPYPYYRGDGYFAGY